MFQICLLVFCCINYVISIELKSQSLRFTVSDNCNNSKNESCNYSLALFGETLNKSKKEVAIEFPPKSKQITLYYDVNNETKFERQNHINVSIKFNCLKNYSGENCQFLSLCKLNPGICKNNGKCNDTKNSVKCSCQNGYTGTFCEEKVLATCEKIKIPYTNSEICVKSNTTNETCICDAITKVNPNVYFSTTAKPEITTLSWHQKMQWPLSPFYTYIVVSAECLFILILLIIIICQCCCCNKQKCGKNKRRPKSFMDDSYLETGISPRMKSTTDHEMGMTHGDVFKHSVINNPNAFHVTNEDLENRHNFKPIYDIRETDGNNNTNADMNLSLDRTSNFMTHHHPSEENDALHPMINDMGDDYTTNVGMSTFGRR